MRKIAAFLVVLGVALFSYALVLHPYKDEQVFMARYMALSDGQSAEYWKLREEMLTPKFQIQDYGITICVTGIAVALASRRGKVRLNALTPRAAVVALAVALPFISVGAYVFDLIQGAGRGEFPHWADSLSIPLMGAPILLVLLLAWSLAHLAFLTNVRGGTVPLSLAFEWRANWWLLLLSVVSAFVALAAAAMGQYWYAFPAVLWLYFYLSLGARRVSAPAT